MRIENILSKTNQQRQLHINRLAARHDHRAQQGGSLIFNDDDMTEVLNQWRKEPQTWMRSDTLQNLSKLRPQAAHQKTKGAFSTMLFELFGNKSLTETFIRFPICSPVQAASILKKFAKAWKTCKETEEYKRARMLSMPNKEPRLSLQIYSLQKRANRADSLTAWIDENSNNWWELSPSDRALWQEHQTGSIRRQIAKLKEKQQPRFPECASSIAHNMEFSRTCTKNLTDAAGAFGRSR